MEFLINILFQKIVPSTHDRCSQPLQWWQPSCQHTQDKGSTVWWFSDQYNIILCSTKSPRAALPPKLGGKDICSHGWQPFLKYFYKTKDKNLLKWCSWECRLLRAYPVHTSTISTKYTFQRLPWFFSSLKTRSTIFFFWFEHYQLYSSSQISRLCSPLKVNGTFRILQCTKIKECCLTYM